MKSRFANVLVDTSSWIELLRPGGDVSVTDRVKALFIEGQACRAACKSIFGRATFYFEFTGGFVVLRTMLSHRTQHDKKCCDSKEIDAQRVTTD